MQNKKGLSDVVTTVLIILLVLAAVAAVWAFINNLISQGGSAVEAQGQCIGLKIEPAVCNINNVGTPTAFASVTAQWTSGTLSAGTSLSGLTYAVIGSNGNRTILTSAVVPASAGQIGRAHV